MEKSSNNNPMKEIRATWKMLSILNRPEDNFGLQVVWPHFGYRRQEVRGQFYIQADTTLNLYWDKGSVIFGLCIFGFGGGFYWKFKK